MLEALRPVLETALDAVVVMRPDGTVAAWNSTAEKTFHWSEAEALGKFMADLIVPPQHREAHTEGLERYLRTGEARVLNRRIEITAIDRSGREFPVELSITAARSGDDQLFIGYLRDISARREEEARLAKQAREARLLFEVTNLSTESASFEEALRVTLRAICAVTGWRVGHAWLLRRREKPELESTGLWHEEEMGEASDLREATNFIHFGPRIGLPGKVLQSGEPEWVADTARDPDFARKGFGFKSAFAFPVTSEGKIVAVLEFFGREISELDPDLLLTVRTLGEQVGRVLERKRTEEHQRLLLNELNHRVKNILAVVQGVASQTFKGTAADPAAKRAFDERLMALAAAHDVLTTGNWEAASIHEVIVRSGMGCGASDQRFRVKGPDVGLRPKSAVALSMALHELCTNAVKYGALSNDVGTVDVSWRVSEGRTLHLHWIETGGPPVTSPSKLGVGSTMIERALASELGGTAELRFEESGLQCLIEAPLDD